MLKIECEDIELSDLILRGRCTTNRLYKKLSSNASFKTVLIYESINVGPKSNISNGIAANALNLF